MKTEATIVMLSDKQRANQKAWLEKEAQKWLALSVKARAGRNAFQYGTDEPPDWWKETSTWIFGIWEDARNARIDLPSGSRRFALKGDFLWLDEQGACQCSRQPPPGYVPCPPPKAARKLEKRQQEALRTLVSQSLYPVQVTVSRPRRGKFWYVEAHAHPEKLTVARIATREEAGAIANLVKAFIRTVEESP